MGFATLGIHRTDAGARHEGLHPTMGLVHGCFANIATPPSGSLQVAAHAASTAATEEALRSAFASVDKSLSSMGLDTEASGCTAAVALLDPTAPRVAVAWCGDSRIVLGRDTRHPGRSAATDGAAGAQAPVQWAEGRGREALTTGGAQAAYESDGEHLRLDDSVEHGADAVLTLDAQAGRASGRVSSRVGADAAGPVSVGPSGVDAHGLRRGLAGPAAGRGMKDSDDAGLGDAARAFESLTLSDGTEGGAEATLLSPPGRLTPLSPSSPQPVVRVEPAPAWACRCWHWSVVFLSKRICMTCPSPRVPTLDPAHLHPSRPLCHPPSRARMASRPWT